MRRRRWRESGTGIGPARRYASILSSGQTGSRWLYFVCIGDVEPATYRKVGIDALREESP